MCLFLVHPFKLKTTLSQGRAKRHAQREHSYGAGAQVGDVLQSSRPAGMVRVCPAVLQGRGTILLEGTTQLTAFGLQLRITK